MRLGFIGVGNVGGALAKKLGKSGHSIFLGSRHAEDSKTIQLAQVIGANASVGSLKKVIEESEIVFLATPWMAVEGLIREYANILEGKILIDCTNPLKPNLAGLLFSGEESGAGFIQAHLPKTKVIKAFNTVGYNIMDNPILSDRKSVMYFAGNDESARHQVRELIQQVGFEPVDAGDIKSASLLENFALLWISSAYKFGLGRDFAFSLIKNKEWRKNEKNYLNYTNINFNI